MKVNEAGPGGQTRLWGAGAGNHRPRGIVPQFNRSEEKQGGTCRLSSVLGPCRQGGGFASFLCINEKQRHLLRGREVVAHERGGDLFVPVLTDTLLPCLYLFFALTRSNSFTYSLTGSFNNSIESSVAGQGPCIGSTQVRRHGAFGRHVAAEERERYWAHDRTGPGTVASGTCASTKSVTQLRAN